MFITLEKFIKKKFIEKDKIEKALKQKYNFILKYSENINIDYLKKICLDKNNKILLYVINQKLFNNYKNEIIGIIIYRIILNNENKIRVYLPLISIHKNMREFGYGTIIFEEFVKKFGDKKTIEIVLLSLESSAKFYEKLGFEKKLIKYIEKNETIDDCVMMSKIILPVHTN